MVDEEVENILAEIRERVRGQELPAALNSTEANEPVGHASLAPRQPLGHPPDTSSNEVVGRLDSYLTVTSRAWDRLPPLMSNRSGSIARIELWVKRQIKRATHWFTWEQINFNAATHHALRDTAEALNANQQTLTALRAEIQALRTETEAQGALLTETQAALQAASKSQREELLTERAQHKAQRAELEAQRASQVAAQRNEMDARLSAVTREMRERIEQLQDEQRVCFKQLSLEATEASVLEDRARRQTEKVIEELRARLEREKQ